MSLRTPLLPAPAEGGCHTGGDSEERNKQPEHRGRGDPEESNKQPEHRGRGEPEERKHRGRGESEERNQLEHHGRGDPEERNQSERHNFPRAANFKNLRAWLQRFRGPEPTTLPLHQVRQMQEQPQNKMQEKPKPQAKNDAGDGNPPAEHKNVAAAEPKNVAAVEFMNAAAVAELLAGQFGREAPGSALAVTAQAFAHEAKKFAQNPSNRNARSLFVLSGRALLGAAKDESPQFAAAVQDILLLAADADRDNPREMSISDAIVGKRQVLYAMALAAPLSLLTSAAGLQLFPGNWAWVAGAGAAVWILATGGMVFNQFGRVGWERIVGGHLGRFGVLGAVILMSFYAYRAYFPSFDDGLFVLICISLLSVGIPWIISCCRHEDDSTATNSKAIATDRI